MKRKKKQNKNLQPIPPPSIDNSLLFRDVKKKLATHFKKLGLSSEEQDKFVAELIKWSDIVIDCYEKETYDKTND